jgi:programmed cell death protein 5
LVKPEKARGVEDMIIRAAQMGQLGEKVDENRLISLLEQISESKASTKITVNENWIQWKLNYFIDTKKKI